MPLDPDDPLDPDEPDDPLDPDEPLEPELPLDPLDPDDPLDPLPPEEPSPGSLPNVDVPGGPNSSVELAPLHAATTKTRPEMASKLEREIMSLDL